jgi:hypothetical protein
MLKRKRSAHISQLPTPTFLVISTIIWETYQNSGGMSGKKLWMEKLANIYVHHYIVNDLYYG